MVCALKEWRHYLHGRPFTVLTDHHSLQHLQTQPHLSRRQVRWSEFLSEFDFTIKYQKGKDNVVADALSRRQDHRRPASQLSHVVCLVCRSVRLTVVHPVGLPAGQRVQSHPGRTRASSRVHCA